MTRRQSDGDESGASMPTKRKQLASVKRSDGWRVTDGGWRVTDGTLTVTSAVPGGRSLRQKNNKIRGVSGSNGHQMRV